MRIKVVNVVVVVVVVVVGIIIVKFQSRKVKARMYMERAKLRHVRVSNLYPDQQRQLK